MEKKQRALHYFLGANTPQGFVSRFDQLGSAEDGWRKFVIKGGPGTGKSSMMKRIAAELEQYCDEIELVYCSSDIESLDALVVPGIKASIADGTAPHDGSA